MSADSGDLQFQMLRRWRGYNKFVGASVSWRTRDRSMEEMFVDKSDEHQCHESDSQLIEN